jgi:Zn ribbon nucleic-acid-binding protein
MKPRTGKECKQIKCKNYDKYSHWASNMGSSALNECMHCKYAHVSQYKAKELSGGEEQENLAALSAEAAAMAETESQEGEANEPKKLG